ncbi:translocation/assembly module TamB domain-containing protein [Flaviaesturariibacter terrae]
MQTEWGQNWLVHTVTARLSRDLRSRVRINHVSIGFFNKLNLEGVLLEDRSKDTLLSAGLVQVRVTDWFFLKDRADLQYIGLRDASIKLQRRDSIWNYQYLVDYFSSPSTGKKKESGIDFDLKKVQIQNLHFTKHDAWRGDDLYARVGWLDLDARQLSLTKNIIDVDRLVLEDALYHEFGYKGSRTDASKAWAKLQPKPADTATLRWNPGRLWVHVRDLQLKNAGFRSDKDGVLGSSKPYFDGRHIDFEGISGTVKELRFRQDTLTANANLVARERGGLQVKTLQADLRFHPELMEFNKLLIRTNSSTLRDYFAMHFASFDDMGDFVDKVRMDGHFAESYITSDDIAIFAPELKSWKRSFRVSGHIKGLVDDFSGEGADLRSGQTSLRGNFSVQGLTNPNNAFLNVEARDLVTSYNDAVTFIPALRTVTMPNLRKLGTIRFTGTYTGFFQDFVTYGTLHTALGSLRTDLNMKLPSHGVPVYSGSISTASFNLGQFFNNSDLGVVDFHGNIKGRGFTRSQLDMDLNGSIHRFQFRGYTYRNITAKGHLNSNSFNGDFAINDPSVEATINGLITFGGNEPSFNATANIVRGNLKALGLSREELALTGKFKLNLKGRSLSDFTGTAAISEATLLQSGRRLSFDSLYVSSGLTGGVRTLNVRSNELDAQVRGQFDLASLPDAFLLFLNRYYPAYIRAPRRASLPRQSFTFHIRTGMIEDYLKILDPRLSGGNNAELSGALDLASNTLSLDADVPQFGFSQYAFTGIQLNARGSFDSLSLNGFVGNAAIGDSVQLPETRFTLRARNDVSDINITTNSNQVVNQASLGARVNTFADGFSVLFHPSSFVLNGKTWTIDQGGTLDFRRNTIAQGNVVLRESNQEIRLSTVPTEDGPNLNDLRISLKNLNIGDFAPFVAPHNRILGVLNGEVKIEDPQNRFYVSADVTTDSLRVDNDSVGQLQAHLNYNRRTGALRAEGSNLDAAHRIRFDVDMDVDDSANTHEDRITLQTVNYPVNYLENFIGGLFSDLRGFVTGELAIVGEGANRRYVGRPRLRDASMKVKFTQVRYWLYDTEIDLEEHSINFNHLRLRDDSLASVAERQGRTATLNGSITHNGFKDMVFDLVARTDNGPITLLNTTYADNQTFYGRAKGTGTFSLQGPQENMNMNIDVRASDRDSSWIWLPPSKSRESGSADFLVERKYGTELTASSLSNSTSNVHYNVNLSATPLVNVEVILDDLTGDAIRGRGTGDLSIESGTNQPLSIRGRYNILDGNYLFTFQSFFKKPFELRTGANNYIQWNGDPYAAQVRFEAIYKATKVRFAPLVQSLALNDPRLERTSGDVNVAVLLTGELFRPNFAFHLEFPTNSPVNTNPSFAYGLQQIESNVNEINKQVTYLIVFNSFAPYQTGEGQGSGVINDFTFSTLSGLLFSQVNKLLNQVLTRVLANSKVTFNFSGSLYNRDVLTQTNRGFGVNTSSLNLSLSAPAGDRVQITFGGTFDVPIPGNNNEINQRFSVYPDVSVDVLINKSGSIRATFFYTQSPDLVVSGASASPIRNQRAGAKLSYRKEFNSLKDLFRRRKQPEPAPDSTQANAEATDPTKRP